MCAIEVLASDLPAPRCMTHDTTYFYAFFDTAGQGHVLRLHQTTGSVEVAPGARGYRRRVVSRVGRALRHHAALRFREIRKAGPLPSAIATWPEPPAVVWAASGGVVHACTSDYCGVTPIVVAEQHATVESVAIDEANYYFASGLEGAVYKRDRSLATREVALASGYAYPGLLATDGSHLFFSGGDGTIQRVPVVGGPVECVTDQIGSATAVAVDDSHVYWTDAAKREIARAAKTASRCSGAVLVLADEQQLPGAIGLGEDHVYWVTFTEPGTIARVVK